MCVECHIINLSTLMICTKVRSHLQSLAQKPQGAGLALAAECHTSSASGAAASPVSLRQSAQKHRQCELIILWIRASDYEAVNSLLAGIFSNIACCNAHGLEAS